MPPHFYLNFSFTPPELRTTPAVISFSPSRGLSPGGANIPSVADMTAMAEIEDNEFTFRGINGSGDINSTFNGTTFINGWGGSMYPSGYTIPEIAAIALFISFAMIVVVVGNMLVIIAIATENALKHITNWFIASLAVADLLLGLVIMPFSLANLLMGYWVFGELWCELHSAIDVLLSTASINNICLISLDRYWSITHAVDYLKDRTPRKAACMIVSVWVLSGLVSIPPLLGWKVDRAPEEFPKCTVSDEIGYVLYSAFGSFYVPSCIMIFVYIRIYYAAKARARRGVAKPKKKKKVSKEGGSVLSCCKRKRARDLHIKNKIVTKTIGRGCEEGVTNTTSFTAAMPEGGNISPRGTSKNGANERTNLLNRKVLICDVRVHEEVSGADRLIDSGDESVEVRPLRTLSQQVDADHQNHNLKGENGLYVRNTLKPNISHGETSLAPPTTPTLRDPSGSGTSSVSPAGTLHRGGSAHSEDGDQLSDIDPSSSDSGALARCSVIKPLKLRFCHPLMGKKLTKPKRELIDMGRVSTPSMLDPEKEKKRIARKKEKRATLILGLIMGSFIACWLPFFFMYILVPLCPFCYIPGYAFDLAFWLGYMNSAFNPVIYTIFNQDFRKAFRKILFK